MMGMHWGTWKLADEANVEPAFDLGVAREQKEVIMVVVVVVVVVFVVVVV